MSELIERLAAALTDEEFQRLTALRKAVIPDPQPQPLQPQPPQPQPLTRLTAPDGLDLSHAYSTIDPWDCNHAALLLQHSGGRVGLHYPDGRFYQILEGMRHDGRNIWDRKNTFIFWYVTGNELRQFDVRDNSTRLVRKFTEYESIDIGVGEGDISENGDYLPMSANDNEFAFLYQISTGASIPAYVIEGLNAVYASPDNHLIVTGKNGVQLVRNDFRGGELEDVFYRQEHMDVGRDINGEEIVVIIDDRNNYITKIRLSDMEPTKLLFLDWSLAGHICCPKGKPWCAVSPYAPEGQTPLYHDSILKLPFDGSALTVLATHHSDVVTGTQQQRYTGEPKAVSSGNQFLFDSREDGRTVVYIGSLS